MPGDLFMKKPPHVAVLLAAFNGEEHIEEQVTSILNQCNVQLDIFVSIDKSSDNTEKIVRKLIQKNKNIFLIDDELVFGSAAKNFFHLMRSFPAEKYDYVALSDQDDFWKDCKMSQAIAKIENNKCDCYASDLECFSDPADKSVKFVLKKSFKQRKFDYLFQGASAGCTYVMKSSVLSKINQLTCY